MGTHYYTVAGMCQLMPCEDGARSLRSATDVAIESLPLIVPRGAVSRAVSPARAPHRLQRFGLEFLIRRGLQGVGPSPQKVTPAVARSQRIRGASPRQDRTGDSETSLVIDADIVS